MINLRSGKSVDIPVDVAKKRLEPTSSQEELQVERELQQTSYKNTGDSSQVPATQ